MAVCKYFLQGNCRFGDKCRYEHPQNNQPQPGGAGIFTRVSGGPAPRQFSSSLQLQPPSQPRGRSPNGPFQPRSQPQSRTPFQTGAFQQSSPFTRNEPERRGRSDRIQSHEQWKPDPGREYLSYYRPNTQEFHLTTEHVIEDLKLGRPEWPLSVFAPHHHTPKDLIDVSREFSPEEIRVQYLMLKAQGQEEAYRQEEMRLANEVAQQCQEILNNVNAAVSYIVKGRNEHPNRWDVINDCNKSGMCPDWVVSKEDRNPVATPTFEQPMQQAPQSNFTSTSGFTQNAALNQPTQQGFSNKSPAFSQPTGFAQQPAFNTQPQQQGVFGNSAPSGVFGAQQQPNDGFDPVSTSQPSNFAGFHNPKSTPVSMSSPFAAATTSGAHSNGQPNIATKQFSTPAFANAGGPVRPPATGQRFAMSPKSQLQHVLEGKQPSAIPDTQAPDSAYGSDTVELEKIYQQVREKGEFPGGIIPEVAPKIEWVGWDWYGTTGTS